jgi:hypothetical protein
MESPRVSVPYVPFKTFLTAIEGFEAGLPRQLDRSIWPSYSGAIQGQLLGALRYLGLIDENHTPTAELRELVGRRDQRKAILRKLIERRYSNLVSLDLSRISPRQFEEAVRQYGASGATLKKAVSFFLQAAQYAGVPMSVLLRAKTRTGGAGHRRASPEAARPAATTSRSVRLRSGGTLTLAASVDLFALDAEDRKFVFELIERFERYERGS